MIFSHNIIGIQPGSFFFDIKIDILWQENSSSFDYKINQNTYKNKDNFISKGGKLLFYAFNYKGQTFLVSETVSSLLQFFEKDQRTAQ